MRADGVEPSDRYLATNLAAVLEAQGRKQSWLAGRLGVSKALVCLIVAGVKTADRARGERIAEALGVPFGLLFTLRERSYSLPYEIDRRPPGKSSPAARTRLVVRQGGQQRVLRPVCGNAPGKVSGSETGRPSPPG
jgi:transcriptional regulator with XRE-family HTH domain